MAKKRIGAGWQYFFWGVINSDGRFIGQTTTGATAGSATGHPMLRLRGARVFPLGIPDNEVITVEGDDEALATFDFEAAALPSGVFEMAVRDNNFEAVVQGTKVQALQQWETGVLQPGSPAFTQINALLQRRSKKFESGVEGVKAWECLYVPLMTVTPKYAEVRTRVFSPYRYSFAVSKGNRNPWGATLSTLLNGTQTAAAIPFDSDNPIMIESYQGNNSQLTFTLSYTPVSGSARAAVTINDVLQTYTTHYTIAGTTVTFIAAPGSSAIVNVMYEVAEGDLS